MDYKSFKNKFYNLPLIFSRDVVRAEKDKQALRNQLNRWQRGGLIIALKRGVYVLNEDDRKITPSQQYIANQLYAPSYVSLEYALSFYGLIPEGVFAVTSVTSRKTARFENRLGEFVYQHVKTEAFRGFRMVTDESGLSFFIGEPEKVIVDFLYLNLKRFGKDAKELFRFSFRFQNLEDLKRSKIMAFSNLFKNKKLTRVSREFCDFLKEEL